MPVAGGVYALELTRVREVVVGATIEPLPGAPPAVLGAINLRGEVLPALDTGLLLGHDPAPAACLIVAEVERGAAALSSVLVPRRATLDTPAGPAERRGALGRWQVDGAPVTLLDIDDLLAPDRIGTP